MLGDAGMRFLSRKISGTECTVHQCDSPNKGPKVAITANIHGDECNGVVVVQQLLDNVSSQLLCGSLILYPSLNPSGLRRHLRTLPPFEKDINRQFPGNIRGDLLEQHVAHIWNDLRSYNLDLVIDLHTDSGESYPYVLLDRSIVSNPSLAEKVWILGEESRMFSIWEYPLRRYRQFNLQNSLAGTVLNQLKIPSLTIEVGPRRHIRASSVALTLKAIQNILASLGMLKKATQEDLGLRVPYGIWRRETGPRTSERGLIFPLAEAGVRRSKGDPIANIINEEGMVQDVIYAPETCVVISYPDIGYIQTGQPVCTLAVLEFEEI